MIANVTESRLTDIAPTAGVPGLYVVENAYLERLLFDRNLVGVQFRRTCFEASKLFVRHLADDLAVSDIAELVILSKGVVYQLAAAAAVALELNLPTNLIATTRVNVLSDEAKVEASYLRFDAGGSRLIVGDTIASGSTVVTALSAYKKVHGLTHVYILSYAGATVGARRISEYCASQGIQCVMLFGLAAFGLGENGFDLSFNHPETIASEVYKARAESQFSGKQVSAVGWDFGSQAMSPTKYRELCWLEAEVFGLHNHPALALEQRPADLDRLSYESGAFSAWRDRNRS